MKLPLPEPFGLLAFIEMAEREEPSREPVAIWVGARRGAERLGASIVECEGDYRTTALAARLFGEGLLDKPRRPGCSNPEDLFSLNDLLPALARAGLRVTGPQA